MNSDLPERVRTREDLELLLARATNYEELRPRSPERPVFKLERVADLLASVGDPHLGVRHVVHVAGSKGKGTVAHMVEAVLRHTGHGRVGLYTSPHLEDLSERVQVDARPASDDALAAAADRLLPHVRRVLGTPHAVTFFEILTAIAWLVFRQHECTSVVLETGLGGRLDATNVCEPDVTLITAIELEHTDILGDTLEAVAGEKAGILKSGVPAATSARPPALQVIEAEARRRGAPLAVIGRDVEVLDAHTGPGPRTTLRLVPAPGDGAALEIVLPLAGTHHAENAALAVWASRQLGVDDASIRSALGALVLPGIAEAVGQRPAVVVDGAHTPVSAALTREAVCAAWPGRDVVLLLAMLQGKDVEGIAGALLEDAVRVRAVVATELPTPRTLGAEDLAGRVARCDGGEGVAVEAIADPAAALARARSLAGPDGLVLATGSVRLAGRVRQLSHAG